MLGGNLGSLLYEDVSVMFFFSSYLLHCKPMEGCEENICRTALARVVTFASQIVSKVHLLD